MRLQAEERAQGTLPSDASPTAVSSVVGAHRAGAACCDRSLSRHLNTAARPETEELGEREGRPAWGGKEAGEPSEGKRGFKLAERRG